MNEMSYKYAVSQVGTNHYVLPRTGGMKVDAHAFLSPELYEATEESLWSQIVAGASHEGVTGAYLMPDTHSGYGVPVGSAIVTDNTLIQAASGYDLGCGMSAIRVPGLHVSDVQDVAVRQRWVAAVELRVATGVGSNRPAGMRGFSRNVVNDVLWRGALAVSHRTDSYERSHIPIGAIIDLGMIERAYAKALPQLGSLGGGNHFIEMQVAADGSVWVMLHTGSRGYGYQTAEHFFFAGAELRGIRRGRREESWLRFDEPLGREYWDYHNTAANYAVANRAVIAQSVSDALLEVFGRPGEVYYDISHNLIQRETLILPDGSTTQGFVHRKGATRAMAAGHPDLAGTRWAETGHPVIIPGSMYDGAAILMPDAGASKTAYTVNHGSGRLLGRAEAKRRMGENQVSIDAEMSDIERTFDGVTVRGIVSNHPHIPIDECRHVYKDLGAVLDVLEAENIAHVATRLWPVANVKGAD